MKTIIAHSVTLSTLMLKVNVTVMIIKHFISINGSIYQPKSLELRQIDNCNKETSIKNTWFATSTFPSVPIKLRTFVLYLFKISTIRQKGSLFVYLFKISTITHIGSAYYCSEGIVRTLNKEITESKKLHQNIRKEKRVNPE